MPASSLRWGTAWRQCQSNAQSVAAEHISVLRGEKNYLSGYDPINLDGTCNVVIEIPAGTTAKYETNKDTGCSNWSRRRRPSSSTLAIRSTYGAIPRSILLKSRGGRRQRAGRAGAWAGGAARLSGARTRHRLSLIDTGELDDKVIVVMENSPFAKVKNIAELDTRLRRDYHPADLVHFVQGYGKDGKLILSSKGFRDRAAAIKLIGDAILRLRNQCHHRGRQTASGSQGNPYLYRSPLAKNIGE